LLPPSSFLSALATSRHLSAFQDLNGDFEFQPDEPSGWFDLRGSTLGRVDTSSSASRRA